MMRTLGALSVYVHGPSAHGDKMTDVDTSIAEQSETQ